MLHERLSKRFNRTILECKACYEEDVICGERGDLIEPYWNVKNAYIETDHADRLRFNRTILECKGFTVKQDKRNSSGFNRTILECKAEEAASASAGPRI